MHIVHASVAMERQFPGPLNIGTGKEQIQKDLKPFHYALQQIYVD